MHGQFTRERDSLHSVVLHDGKPRSARGSGPERFEQLRASLSLQDQAQTGAIPTAAFRAVLQRKDLGLAVDAARELGLLLPNATTTWQLYNSVIANGQGDDDQIAVLKVLEELAGHRLA